MAEKRQIGIPDEPLDYTSDFITKPYELDNVKKYEDQKHEVLSGEIKRTVVGENWKIPTESQERRPQVVQALEGLERGVGDTIKGFFPQEQIKWRTDPVGAALGWLTAIKMPVVVGGAALLEGAESMFPETFGALKPKESAELTRDKLEQVWEDTLQKESQKLEQARTDLESGKISQVQYDAMEKQFDTLVSRRQKAFENLDKYNATVQALDGTPYPNAKVADTVVSESARYLQMRELNNAIEMAQKGIDPESTGFKIGSLAGPTAVLGAIGFGGNYLSRYGLSGALRRITTDVETEGGAARLAAIKPVRSRRQAARAGMAAVEVGTEEMESAQYVWQNVQDYIERTGDKTLENFTPNDAQAFTASAYGAIAGKIETMGGIENIAAGAFRRLGVGGFGRRVVATGAEEFAEEGLQNLSEYLSRRIDGTTDKTLGEALEESLNAAAWGGFMGIGFGTIGGVTYRNARKQGIKVLQDYGLSRETAEKVFDNMIEQTTDAISPRNEPVRENIRKKVSLIYEGADMSPAELEDTIEATTDLEMAMIAYDSANRGIDIADHPLLNSTVNNIGWFRDGIPEQIADQVEDLDNEIGNLRRQLAEENAKEKPDMDKIDDLEAKIEQFYAKLPKEVSDLVETDRQQIRQMLAEQSAELQARQAQRRIVQQVQKRATSALQREQESDVQKSLRRLEQESKTEEKKAKETERQQRTQQRKLRKAIEKLRQNMIKRKNNLPLSQELFADADLVYQALRDSGFSDQQIATMAEEDIVKAVAPYGISPVAKQMAEQFDLANENARLDEIYPAYDGDSIEIFDYDTNAISDWADKNIEKQDSFETDEGVFTNYKLVGDNRNMPTFTVFESKDGWIVRNAYIPESEQNKGIGTKFYQYMNEQSIQKTGNPLRSTQPRKLTNGKKVFELSDLGKKLWESLVKKGLATKNKNGTYKFNRPQQRTVYNSEGKRINKSAEALTNFWRWFGDSKVVDEQGRPLVVYHGGKKGIKSFSNRYAAEKNMFFFTNNRGIAEDYRGYNNKNIEDTMVYSMYLKITNPLVLRNENDLETFSKIMHPDNETLRQEWLDIQQAKLKEWVKDFDISYWFGQETIRNRDKIKEFADKNGYDGIFNYEPDTRGGFSKNSLGFIAFKPTQIKSTENSGAFSSSTGNIYYQDDPFSVAEENARLDDIYPAYDGETIEVDGKERTVYNSNGDRIAKSKEALTNFWRWFGDSKVVDEKGRPIVMYHGSKTSFDEFYRSSDIGFHFGSKGAARIKAGRSKQAVVYNVYLKIQNPLKFDRDLGNWDAAKDGYLAPALLNMGIITKEQFDALRYSGGAAYSSANAKLLRDALQEKGYDGIEYPNYYEDTGKISYVAFEPTQIKSVDNRGTFSSETPNIYWQRVNQSKKRGFYSPELRLVSLLQAADPSSLSHELAHDWMQQFFRWYRSGKASESFMQSWGALEKALGISPDDINVPEKASEAFARAYEAWVMTKTDWEKGIDIDDENRDKIIELFKRYQGYLTDIYEDLNNPYFLETWGETGKLKPELQAWFDKVTIPTDLISAQVATGAITPEEAQTKAITRTVNQVVQAAEDNFTQKEKDEINAVERLNDTSRYEVKGGNKNSLQNRLSGLARDIDANNIALGRYDTHRDMLAVAQAADEFVRTRRDEALNIINGLEPEKEGLYASDLYTAFERLAMETNDVDLALDLVNSKVAQDLAKEWGQRVAGFRNFTGDGEFDAISQIKSLDNKYKKDYDEKGKERVKSASDEFVKELDKTDSDQDLDSFFDSVKCQ